uniref:Uncharacterized protein n=1 Tax=Arundo donax TaxID=35708 RepID=A0A0A9D701_ARUDO
MELVSLAWHNLKNAWLLCKPTANSQVKKKPTHMNELRSTPRYVSVTHAISK